MALAKAHLRAKCHLHPSSRLATIDLGRKLGGAGSPSNTRLPGLQPTSIPTGILIHPAIWPQQIWAGRKLGAVPLCRRGALSTSNTMWPGPTPTCMPSFILIHPTVWPQYIPGWGPSSPPVKGHSSPPIFGQCRYGQTAGWTKTPLGMEVGLGPGYFVFDGDPAPRRKKGTAPPPNFWPMSIVAKRLDGSRCHLVRS